ncbi:helix-turn-helix transcriptional regulator [Priestia aryabhattai]|uniref:helix-turn-helix transcriptional regulator n=1 Tax=Priestia aryabhattai TaxID=412384 RepID=UPI001ADC229D|nr:helix-turn-helix transcriptional regulator [Priestia aryabhattai]QTL49962.1 helix-turn-helix transcriptional regulator [Priestia aryabhattai]
MLFSDLIYLLHMLFELDEIKGRVLSGTLFLFTGSSVFGNQKYQKRERENGMYFDKNINSYNQPLTHEYIKPIRVMRNKTQSQMGEMMTLDASTVGKLERGELDFSPLYESKLRDAIRRLRVSRFELNSIYNLLEVKKLRGYK